MWLGGAGQVVGHVIHGIEFRMIKYKFKENKLF